MSSVALYQRLLRQARPYWLHLAALSGLGLLASPVALLTPVPLKIVVDSVLGGHPLPAFLQPLVPDAAARSPDAILLFAIGLLVAVAALGQVQTLASTLLRAYVGERLVLDFRARLVEQVQRLSASYHDSREPPTLSTASSRTPPRSRILWSKASFRSLPRRSPS